MRSRLSTTFASGRIKQMFYLIKDIGNGFNEILLEAIANENTQSFCREVKDLCTRFTTDVIASCAFGIKADSLKNPDGSFRKYGKQIFTFSYYRAIEVFSTFFLPEIVPLFRFKVFTKGSSDFFSDSINFIMEEREKSGSVRNDLIDTLITLKNEDKFKKLDSSEVLFQGDSLVAQAAIFFTAGHETSSALMAFGLYELAFKPKIQERMREEIKITLAECNGDLTYEAVQKMTYLNMVVSECIRMYPPLPYFFFYLLPYSDFVIPKNMPIVIPIFSIHRDAKHYPNPELFDPERFSKENKEKIAPATYLPFGAGPHNCVGERFGLLQSKVGFVNFFRNHYVTPTASTPKKIILEPKALIIQPLGGIELNIVRDPIEC